MYTCLPAIISTNHWSYKLHGGIKVIYYWWPDQTARFLEKVYTYSTSCMQIILTRF